MRVPDVCTADAATLTSIASSASMHTVWWPCDLYHRLIDNPSCWERPLIPVRPYALQSYDCMGENGQRFGAKVYAPPHSVRRRQLIAKTKGASVMLWWPLDNKAESKDSLSATHILDTFCHGTLHDARGTFWSINTTNGFVTRHESEFLLCESEDVVEVPVSTPIRKARYIHTLADTQLHLTHTIRSDAKCPEGHIAQPEGLQWL